jgi:hypothetical protein
MATPVEFPQANDVLKPAKGTEDSVTPLPIYRQGLSFEGGVRYEPCVVSGWKLTPEEQAEVARTGMVYVQAFGQTHPPLSIWGSSPFAPQPNEQR